MIALPFHDAPPPPAGFKFRLLMNQYNEELRFAFVDDDVPNRGLSRVPARPIPTSSSSRSITSRRSPRSRRKTDRQQRARGRRRLPIHHEPGLWLYEKNRRSMDDQIKGDQVSEVELDVARLASIPHGNSVLALGSQHVIDGMPEIPPISGLPSGRFEDVSTPDYDFKSDPYLEPYKHYIDNPFMGTSSGAWLSRLQPGRHERDPSFREPGRGDRPDDDADRRLDPEERRDPQRPVLGPRGRAGQHEVDVLDPGTRREGRDGKPRLRLQYSQVVMLHFFRPREDEFPERAVWPHISIATLEKMPGIMTSCRADLIPEGQRGTVSGEGRCGPADPDHPHCGQSVVHVSPFRARRAEHRFAQLAERPIFRRVLVCRRPHRSRSCPAAVESWRPQCRPDARAHPE